MKLSGRRKSTNVQDRTKTLAERMGVGQLTQGVDDFADKVRSGGLKTKRVSHKVGRKNPFEMPNK